MKRYRRLVSLQTVTDQMVRQHRQPEFRQALVEALPLDIFGSAIAGHVTHATIQGRTLILQVPDEAWRRELQGRKETILRLARGLESSLNDVKITS